MSIDDYHDSIRRYRDELLSKIADNTRESASGVDPDVPVLTGIVENTAATSEDRAEAVATLNALSFSDANYSDWRPQYLEALRKLATDDDERLRIVAFENLIAHGDVDAPQTLVDELGARGKLSIPAAVALRILAGNAHTGAVDVAREYANDPDLETRIEALRVMAGDASSVGYFSDLLVDEMEDDEVRAIAATALSGLDVNALQNASERLTASRGAQESARKSPVSDHVDSLLRLRSR